MGFHVDYDKTLQQQYYEYLEIKKINANKLDSLSEKVESSIADMHRPIFASKTATSAQVFAQDRSLPRQVGPEMSLLTYDYLVQTVRSSAVESFVGVVSSYNRNTFTGRFFVGAEQRPIPFELVDSARNPRNIDLITSSLKSNAYPSNEPAGIIELQGFRVESRTGRLKAVHVTQVQDGTLDDHL